MALLFLEMRLERKKYDSQGLYFSYCRCYSYNLTVRKTILHLTYQYEHYFPNKKKRFTSFFRVAETDTKDSQSFN